MFLFIGKLLLQVRASRSKITQRAWSVQIFMYDSCKAGSSKANCDKVGGTVFLRQFLGTGFREKSKFSVEKVFTNAKFPVNT